jgi:hypothetical protein
VRQAHADARIDKLSAELLEQTRLAERAAKELEMLRALAQACD